MNKIDLDYFASDVVDVEYSIKALREMVLMIDADDVTAEQIGYVGSLLTLISEKAEENSRIAGRLAVKGMKE